MGKKYDDAIRRIKGIEDNLQKAATDLSEDNEEVKAQLMEAWAGAGFALHAALNAIEGETTAYTDYEVARAMVRGVALVNALQYLAHQKAG